MSKTDILIIGTGIAGLSFAIKTARRRKDLNITVMTKAEAETTNTKHAQGGIAVVMDNLKDSFDQHITDTLASGAGGCDPEIVQMVIRQAPARLQELIDLGVAFDRTADKLDLALEGGHSQRRIVHHSDSTGLEIEKSLLAEVRRFKNITLLEHHFALDLQVEEIFGENRCVGAFYFDAENTIRYIRAKVTVLSTGGCGQIFRHTTNAEIATGDGVAMASRVNARISEMQFVQFHPTAFYEPGQNPYFLLSEALRGFGAHVINHKGKRFLFKHDLRGELATRDVVSRAIVQEMRESGEKHVYLDCRHIPSQLFQKHFSAIAAYCTSRGIDPSIQLIPIVPVAHYQCGGINVDKDGQTSVGGLFAIGECARTGLHGKNRLASNSLLEAAVFAHQASAKVCELIDWVSHSTKVYINKSAGPKSTGDDIKIARIKNNLRRIMEQFYIDDGREEALFELSALRDSAANLYAARPITRQIIETINMLTVGMLIIKESEHKNLITTKIN